MGIINSWLTTNYNSCIISQHMWESDCPLRAPGLGAAGTGRLKLLEELSRLVPSMSPRAACGTAAVIRDTQLPFRAALERAGAV